MSTPEGPTRRSAEAGTPLCAGIALPGDGSAETQASILQQFERELREHGLWHAVGYLNGTTDYRFTGLYRFVGNVLHNLVLFDREDSAVRTAPDADSALSYCRLMRASGESFRVADASDDARTAGHPSRLVVRSYCGVPLVDENGVVFGSICHFAEPPTLLHDQDLEILLQVPAALAAAGIRL